MSSREDLGFKKWLPRIEVVFYETFTFIREPSHRRTCVEDTWFYFKCTQEPNFNARPCDMCKDGERIISFCIHGCNFIGAICQGYHKTIRYLDNHKYFEIKGKETEILHFVKASICLNYKHHGYPIAHERICEMFYYCKLCKTKVCEKDKETICNVHDILDLRKLDDIDQLLNIMKEECDVSGNSLMTRLSQIITAVQTGIRRGTAEDANEITPEKLIYNLVSIVEDARKQFYVKTSATSKPVQCTDTNIPATDSEDQTTIGDSPGSYDDVDETEVKEYCGITHPENTTGRFEKNTEQEREALRNDVAHATTKIIDIHQETNNLT